jgi:Flp pilus assembly protein TadG
MIALANLRARLERFARDRRGGPMIEFALTAPILALLIVGVIAVGFEVDARMDVREAVRAGAHAVMGGQDDPEVIRQIVLSALDGSSEGYVAEVTQEFRCGSTVVDMDDDCSDGDPSREFFIIDLSAPAGVAYSDAPAIDASIEVRIG